MDPIRFTATNATQADSTGISIKIDLYAQSSHITPLGQLWVSYNPRRNQDCESACWYIRAYVETMYMSDFLEAAALIKRIMFAGKTEREPLAALHWLIEHGTQHVLDSRTDYLLVPLADLEAPGSPSWCADSSALPNCQYCWLRAIALYETQAQNAIAAMLAQRGRFDDLKAFMDAGMPVIVTTKAPAANTTTPLESWIEEAHRLHTEQVEQIREAA